MSDELFRAIELHDPRRVASLLAQGSDPNATLTKPPRWRPLEAAIEEVYHGGSPRVMLEIIKLLIQHGADVNAWDDKQHLTPLLAALYWDNREAARLLLDAGADPTVVNGYRETPLRMAVEKDDVEMAAELLRRGADKTINLIGGFDGYTPLGLAAANLNLPMIELLIEAGADPELLDGDGDTARDHMPPREKSDPEVWDAALELLARRSA
jgi:ankyrin repeat protein